MENRDLLEREDEFKKLNEQIENKTESLMKEIEDEMQKQDIFSEFTYNVYYNTNKSTIQHNMQKPCKTPKKNTQFSRKKLNPEHGEQNTRQELKNGTQNHNHSKTKCSEQCKEPAPKLVVSDSCDSRIKFNDMEFLYAFVSVNVKDGVLPQSFIKDGVTVENVCKFLSSKVKLMQEQIDKLQNTIEKKASQCEMHMTQVAELESQKLALLTATNNMKATTAEARAKSFALQNRLDEKVELFRETRSESDKLSAEVQMLRSKAASLEARCAAQEHSLETMKQQLEAAKKAEKDDRESFRKLNSASNNYMKRLRIEIKCMEKQIHLQRTLATNLKKQNELLITRGALDILESDYYKMLQQGSL